MKKILGLTVAALLILAIVGGGTWAYFSSAQTFTGNLITAGTLNLTVGSGASDNISISGATVKPGTANTTAKDWNLTNSGTLDGVLQLAISAITNVDAQGAGAGTLGGNVTMALWYDAGTIGVWDSGDYYYRASDLAPQAYTGGDPASLPTAAWATVDSYDGKTGTNTTLPVVAAGTTLGRHLKVQWQFPESGYNDSAAMGDSVVFNITVTLRQAP